MAFMERLYDLTHPHSLTRYQVMIMNYELFNHRKNVIREMIYDENYIPLKMKDMAFFLGVSGEEREELRQVVEALVEEGIIERTAKGKYIRPQNRHVTGIFSSTERGFGFVRVDDSEEEIFIPPTAVNGAFHKDHVRVRVKQAADRTGRKAEGMIVDILERGITSLIGVWMGREGFGFVLPDDRHIGKDIYVSQKRSMGAENGDKVVVFLRDYGREGGNPEGEIREILGKVTDPETDVTSVLRAFAIEEAFPKAALKEAKLLPDWPDTDQVLLENPERKDFRELLTVTIDGEDARDLDDAITISKEEDSKGIHYHLGVHIADVTEYVREGSALDREAWNRGTSVYLADRVVPMLPRRLSNGICSLNAGQDRLALSCMMTFDPEGKVTDYGIVESVIRVDQRLSYNQVQGILENRSSIEGQIQGDAIQDGRMQGESIQDDRILSMCYLMAEAAAILKEKRRRRGAIDFDFPEAKIYLDDQGRVSDVRPYERNTATDIIEDFMLLANETIAEDAWWQEIPFIYRVHEDPDPHRIAELGVLIRNFGYHLKAAGNHFHPKEIQKLLFSLEGRPEEALISRLALRSMKKARYTSVNTGHFGLSAKYYTHFTSPIRRYPDLQIHRIIKDNIHGRLGEDAILHYEEILPGTASHSSERERRAQEAEREVEKLKKIEYMSHYLKETYEGVISGVTAGGLFVELENTVEGFVPIFNLYDDYYIYDQAKYRMYGQDLGKEYKLGQKVRVMVAQADKTLRRVEFEIIE